MMNRRNLSLLAGIALLPLPLAAQAGGPCNLQWQPETANGPVEALLALPNGDLIAGGPFTAIGGIAANGIARRTSAGWQPLGSGVQGTVLCLARLPNGNLVAGGQFASAGGVAANHIARWDGTNWAPLGTGPGGVSGQFFPMQPLVSALAVLPNGDLAVGGHFLTAGNTAAQHLARWDSVSWHDLGGGVQSSHLNPLPLVQAMAVMANGDLAIGGQFVLAGSGAGTILAANLARWNGTAWTAMASGWVAHGMYGPVQQLRVLANGDLVGCGSDRAALPIQQPFVARWTGTSWQSLAGNLTGTNTFDAGAHSIVALPNGDLLTGGHNVTTTPGGPATALARRSGSTWSAIGTPFVGRIRRLAALPDGTIAVAGDFTAIGGAAASHLAMLAPTRPAATTSVGPGCAGAAGVPTLTATSLPWLGGTLRTRCDQVPANALAVAVTSLSPLTVPLSLVLPIAAPGCDGLAIADLADLLLPSGGSVTLAIPLPPQPAFVGIDLWQCVAVLEFAPSGAATALTASNRLRCTTGLF
jgi:trimeric autotransporter adhesin